MKDQKEDRNRKIALATTIGVHALLMVLFLFIMAWREPNPPYPEFGVVLNYGVDQAASGDVQPETQPTEETDEMEESTPVESQPEVQEEVSESSEEVVEETTDNVQESPVTVPKEIKKEEKPVEKPKETTAEKPTEEKKEEQKVKAAFPSNDPAKDASTPSQGDKTGAGDQGDPEGDLNEDALYGTPGGGGGGSSFDLEGWNWDWIPKPDDTSDENGRLVFRIKVNADGEVIGITTLERSVSPSIEKLYRAEVQKLTFSRKSSSGTAPPVSTGTITFVIKSK